MDSERCHIMKGMIFMRKDFGKQTIVTPLPVLIIATYGDDGRPDAMNAAWGGQVDNDMVHVELDNSHLTTDNIKRRKAFTVSFADRKNLVMADYFGLVSGRKEDKIAQTGAHVEKSAHVDAPVITDFPLTLECRLVSVSEEFGGTRVVGEVVNMSADESILDEKGHVDLGKGEFLCYDPAAFAYRVIGERAGAAFKDGHKIGA